MKGADYVARKLTEQQRRFADAYIELGKTYPAAIKAGYSKNYAKAQAHKLLENVGIASYINDIQAKLLKESIATYEEVMQFYTSISRGELSEELVMITPGGEVVRADKGADIKTRILAANELMKRLAIGRDEEETDEVVVIGFDEYEEET